MISEQGIGRAQVQGARGEAETVAVPASALRRFLHLLAEVSQGNAVTLIPTHAELQACGRCQVGLFGPRNEDIFRSIPRCAARASMVCPPCGRRGRVCRGAKQTILDPRKSVNPSVDTAENPSRLRDAQTMAWHFFGHGARCCPLCWPSRDHLKNDCFRGAQLDKRGVNSCNDGV